MDRVYSLGLRDEQPSSKELEGRFETMKKELDEMVLAGTDEAEIRKKLDAWYEEGKRTGMYSPGVGPSAEATAAALAEHMRREQYSEDFIQEQVKSDLKRGGYVDTVRWKSKSHEESIQKPFNDFFAGHELTKDVEDARVEKLRAKCFRLDASETSHALRDEFPGGNYLYHGTAVEQVAEILEAGNLVNRAALIEQEKARQKREPGTEKKIIANASGYEGISWNFNQIGAMPGDRNHLVGFLGSPNKILTEQTQLAVPSRPAPHELILIDGDIDSRHFYETKTQQELLQNFGFGESNSVLSNLIVFSIFKENGSKPSSVIDDPMLHEFVQTKNKEIPAEELRRHYTVLDNGLINFLPDLLQQRVVPVAAVYLQALIDTGRIKNVAGLENMATVREAIERIDDESYKSLLKEVRREKIFLEDSVKAEDDKVKPFAIKTSELYLVVSDSDLPNWLRVLARCPTEPKGILVYDHKKIRLEHFATLHHGDIDALGEELRKAIPVSEGHVDYEVAVLGEPITLEKMTGHKKHVIAEKYLTHRKAIKKGPGGALQIVD